MNEAVFCVYRIRNTVNSKIYIGITCAGLGMRWNRHKSAANMGKSKSLLYEDMRAYGFEAFSIESIEEDIPSTKAYDREAYWIDRLCSVAPHGYNHDNGSIKRARSRV